MPKVYIIIVNFKGWADTIECIESLLKLIYPNFQVIVIDNSPDRSSFQQIDRWATSGISVETNFPEFVIPQSVKPLSDYISISQEQLFSQKYDQKVILVKANENAGFSAANNIALKYALACGDFQFAWLLNNDTVTEKASLTHLVESMNLRHNSDIGILGAKVLEYENRFVIQSAGGGRLIKPLAYSSLIGAGEKDSGQFDTEDLQMDFVAGTSMFVRYAFLQEIGLLNEEYFLYFEEPDWAERAKKGKWRMGYCFKARVFHKGGTTTGGKGYSSGKKSSTYFSDFYFQRAKILFTKNYYWYFLPTVYLSFIVVIFNRIRRREFDRLQMLLRILFSPNKRLHSK